MKKALIKRWTDQFEWQEKRLTILKKMLRSRTCISEDRIDGYYDLRGIELSPVGDKQLVFRKTRMEGVDFSFADLSKVIWEECDFTNCKFDSAVFKNATFIACNFMGSVFNGASFRDCELANNKGKHAGSFREVVFNTCSFKRVDFNFPLIDSCSFTHCDFNRVDFDGSRFMRTKFAGKVEAAEFRGYSLRADNKTLLFFQSFDPKTFPNKMEDVDFETAELAYVGFSHGVDLSKCKFRLDSGNILIKNPKACFDKVKKILMQDWDEEDRQGALDIIDRFWFSWDKQDMPVIFLNKVRNQSLSQECDDKLFDLVKAVSTQTR